MNSRHGSVPRRGLEDMNRELNCRPPMWLNSRHSRVIFEEYGEMPDRISQCVARTSVRGNRLSVKLSSRSNLCPSTGTISIGIAAVSSKVGQTSIRGHGERCWVGKDPPIRTPSPLSIIIIRHYRPRHEEDSWRAELVHLCPSPVEAVGAEPHNSTPPFFIFFSKHRRTSSAEHYHRHHIRRTVVLFEEWASTSHRAEWEDVVCVEWADTFIREAKNSRDSRGWSISVLVGRCRNVMKTLTTSASTEWNRSNDYATTSWISTTEDRQRHYCYDEHFC